MHGGLSPPKLRLACLIEYECEAGKGLRRILSNTKREKMMRKSNIFGLLTKVGAITLLLWSSIELASTQPLGTFSMAALAASPLEQVIEGAKKEGKVVIYESQRPTAWAKIMAVFQKRYPFIKEYDHERLSAGDINIRVISETQAGVPTADVFGNSPSTSFPLIQRGLLMEVDWKALGVSEKIAYDRYTAIGNMFAYVIGYNTQLVPPKDVPKTWEDLLDPKWKGKGAYWRFTTPWSILAADWGLSRTEEYLKKFMANDFRASRSTATVAAWLSAGEVPVGVVVLHRLQAAQQKGAPVGWVFAEPVPVTQITYGVIKGAKNPNAAKLLVHWLTSPEGAKTYEKQTFRGNPYIPGTEFGKLMGRLNVVYYPAERLSDYLKATEAVKTLLQRLGR